MNATKAIAVVALGGGALYFLFIRRNPVSGLALVDELIAPRYVPTDQATAGPGGLSGYGPSLPMSTKTAAIGAIGATSAAVAGLWGAGGTTAAAGAAATTAATAGGAGTTAVAGGIGLAGTLAITGGIAGGVLLTWAVWKKGLFRGGEEALLVNPDRDQFLAQPAISSRPDGEDGSAWTKTNSWKLAAQLVEWGQPDGGGPLYVALQQADKVDAFTTAARAIQRIYAEHGIRIQAP
jgi:hypothetical protein